MYGMPPVDPYALPPAKTTGEGEDYYGFGLEQNSEIAKLQLETSDILSQLEAFLTGKIVDDKGKVISIGKPFCNKIGINRILSLVSVRFNRNTILSNLTYEDIKTVCICLRANLINELRINFKEWEVKTPTDAMTILNNVDDMVFLNLSRGLTEGGTGKSLLAFSKIIQHRDVVSNIPQKKGFLNKLGL